MDNLNWCFKQKKGIKIIKPNSGVAKSYLREAKKDFSLINKEEHKWSIIKEYYVCYNSLYSLLVKCGIKCEIHDCTIKLMYLFNFGDELVNDMIDLKKERLGVQYYLTISKKDYFDFTKRFLEFCEVKFLELNDFNIKKIRSKLESII